MPMFRYNSLMKKYKTKPWTDNEMLFQYKEKQYHEKDTTKRQRKMAAAKNREKKRQGSTNAPPKLF